MTATILIFVQLFGLAMVYPTTASCPDVNKALNCSFESENDCLKSYNKQDKHGLKWKSNVGSVVDDRYNYEYRYDHGLYRRHRIYQSLLDASSHDEYLYIPGTNDTRAIGLWTELVSPPFTADNQGCLYFYFHNSVCGDEYDPLHIPFKVSLRLDSNYKVGYTSNNDILLREYPCIDTSLWYSERVPIVDVSGIYRIVFSAKQHGILSQALAVDHVTYSDKSCSIQDDINFEDGDCDFEDTNLCGYQVIEDRKTKLRWLPVRREMFMQESFRDAAPAGYFLALWGYDERQVDEIVAVHVQSPVIRMRSEGCLSLTYFCGRYHLDNDNLTALIVSRIQATNKTKSVLYELPATLGGEPIKGFVPLPEGEYAIRFTAAIKLPFGDNGYDVIGLDDIEVHEQSCDQVRCESAVCEDTLLQTCNGRGKCLGKGLKHKSCKCNDPYIGKDCEYNPNATSTYPRTYPTRYPWQGK